jgi:hypothetical protein
MDLGPVFVNILRQNMRVSASNAISRAVQAAGSEVPRAMEILGKSFQKAALPRSQLASINKAIAGNAQAAMVAGWRSRLPRGNSGGALSGTLGDALASESMTAHTTDRVISFVNTDVLRQTAKHWYRINYGAAGPNMAGGVELQAFTVKLNNRPFLVLRDDAPPAPLSWLPRVFDWTPEGRMIVIRGPAEPRGKGSRAARFTDLGLAVVAEQFGPAYDQFLRDWIQDEAHRARLGRRGIHVEAEVRLDSYSWHVVSG